MDETGVVLTIMSVHDLAADVRAGRIDVTDWRDEIAAAADALAAAGR